jgi:cardiolipin hydrolase
MANVIFSSVQLADVVLAGVSRGVRVRLILDHASVDMSGSQAGRFRQKGAFVRSKALTSCLMHHKFVVVDGAKLLSGSFNWTMQAVMGNKENVIVSHDPSLVQPFVVEFERLWEEVRHVP